MIQKINRQSGKSDADYTACEQKQTSKQKKHVFNLINPQQNIKSSTVLHTLNSPTVTDSGIPTKVQNPTPRNQVCKPSFEQIYFKYNSQLTYYARKLLGDQSIAEDIASEVFLKYWNRQEKFINEFAAIAFLKTSTRNACLNHIRYTRRHRKNEKRYRYITNECEDFVLNEITKAEIITEAWNIIDSLPEGCRRIVIMSYVNGIDDQEIAGQLNISQYTVRNQKVRGLYLIRKKYKELERLIEEHHVVTDRKLDEQSKNAKYLAVMKVLFD